MERAQDGHGIAIKMMKQLQETVLSSILTHVRDYVLDHSLGTLGWTSHNLGGEVLYVGMISGC